jgi:hypothetical protein
LHGNSNWIDWIWIVPGIVGEPVVGDRVGGVVVGEPVVGLTVVGLTVVGLAVVGLAVVGLAVGSVGALVSWCSPRVYKSRLLLGSMHPVMMFVR